MLDPDLHAPTDRIDAKLRMLASEEKSISQWFPVRLHHAAKRRSAHIVLLDDSCNSAWRGRGRSVGARSPNRGGGPRPICHSRRIGSANDRRGRQFIDLRPPARRRRSLERKAQRDAFAIPDAPAALAALLAAPPLACDLSAFARDRALPDAQTRDLVEKLDLVLLESGASKIAVSSDRWSIFTSSLVEHLATFHVENPDQQGIGREKLRILLKPRLRPQSFSQPCREWLATAIWFWTAHSCAWRRNCAPGRRGDEAPWSAITPLLGGVERFRPPRVRDIAGATGRPESDVRRLLKLAARMGLGRRGRRDHFFLRATVREMRGDRRRSRHPCGGRWFTAAQFRDRAR